MADGYRWFEIAPGTYRVLREEAAPNDKPGILPGKYRTWFIARCPQPDGVCMNCRSRPGRLDARSGTRSCDDCLASCALALGLTCR